jgi:hypothetical protein
MSAEEAENPYLARLNEMDAHYTAEKERCEAEGCEFKDPEPMGKPESLIEPGAWDEEECNEKVKWDEVEWVRAYKVPCFLDEEGEFLNMDVGVCDPDHFATA